MYCIIYVIIYMLTSQIERVLARIEIKFVKFNWNSIKVSLNTFNKFCFNNGRFDFSLYEILESYVCDYVNSVYMYSI